MRLETSTTWEQWGHRGLHGIPRGCFDTANRWPSSLKLLYKDGYREGYIVAFLPDNKAVFVPSINGHANPEQWEIISLEVSE